MTLTQTEQRRHFASRIGSSVRNGIRSSHSPVLDSVTIALVVAILLTMVVGPIFAPDVSESHITEALQAPSGSHWFGTDQQGRDVLWRIVVGSRTTIPAAMVVVAGYALIGVLVGTAAAIGPRWIREMLLRFIDVGLSIPGLVIALGIAATLGASIFTAMIALIVTGWPMTARILYGLVTETRTQGFVDGAMVLGASKSRVLARHVLPNALPPLWVKWTGDVGMTTLAIGGLSFIGAGAQPPSPEWGAMVGESAGLFSSAWWAAFFPGLAIVITSTAFALLGDLLHIRLNPEFERGPRQST